MGDEQPDQPMRWPPYEHVFFDCDSTLTTVEGVDVLADRVGRGSEVAKLTRAAMEGDRDLEEVYGARLDAISPTRAQILALRDDYKRHAVEDARPVIEALQSLGHQVYIISGGLLEPVREFGVSLGVPAANIRAVSVEYDQLSGDWWRGADSVSREREYLAYERSALAVSDGKARVVRECLGGRGGRCLLVGDGVSDLLTAGSVDLFVGFGGVVSRDEVERGAPVFIRCQSLAPVLPLAAGPAAIRRCQESTSRTLFEHALARFDLGVSFRERGLRQKFIRARAEVD